MAAQGLVGVRGVHATSGDGRIELSDRLAQTPYQDHPGERGSLSGGFPGRHVREVADRIVQLTEPSKGGFFDDGFVNVQGFSAHCHLRVGTRCLTEAARFPS